nr:hypothetical protein OG999_02245 [Streptomyces sp. NBC_00886]
MSQPVLLEPGDGTPHLGEEPIGQLLVPQSGQHTGVLPDGRHQRAASGHRVCHHRFVHPGAGAGREDEHEQFVLGGSER